MTLVDSDGNTIEINYILHKDYSCEYRGDDGMEYTDNGDETYTDENGNTYAALNDDTHHLGHTLEQHDLQDADGNTVTVTETTMVIIISVTTMAPDLQTTETEHGAMKMAAAIPK